MNSQKKFWIVTILAVIIIILIGVLILVPVKKNPQQNPSVVVNGIEITSPKQNEEVLIPFKITGIVNGNGWAGFEGQVGRVELVQDSMRPNEVMASAVLRATSEWTVLPINFEADIPDVSQNTNIGSTAKLIFHNENPSGDPSKDKIFSLQIKIK